MARYIDAEKIKYHELSVCGGHGLNCEYTVAHKHEVDAIPTEDVVQRDKVAREILSDLKKQIHDKAIYPGARDAYSFVNIKVFDAVLNNVLIKYTEGEK